MINLTGRIQFLASDIELHQSISISIKNAITILEENEGRAAAARDYQAFAFATMFRAGIAPKSKQFDEKFIEAAFDLSQSTPSKFPKQALKTLKTYSTAPDIPASGIKSLRRGLKLLLVDLWHNNVLLLPTVFNSGPGFEVGRFSCTLINWVRAFSPNGTPSEQRLFYFGHRLLWASTWKTPKDVSLDEIAALTRARVLHHRGDSTEAIASAAALPVGIFAAKLQAAYADEVTFTSDDLSRYSNWSLSHAIAQLPFDQFSTTSVTTTESPKDTQLRAKHEGAAKFTEPRENESPHDTILRNFKNIKNLRSQGRSTLDWREGNIPSYPGRDHIKVDELSKAWTDCFCTYLRHREKIQGYRSTGETLAALNLLADYLFYYLPWWLETNPDSKVELPLTPRQFNRYAFVARHTSAPVTELPTPLLELIRLRRSSNESARVVVNALSLFFRFVETHYADDENIAGPSFKSPISVEFDAPRINTKSKTTKEVIPKQIYGYLLFYCYAIEQFGMHLEEMAKRGSLPSDRVALTNANYFTGEAFGSVPIVRYRDKTFSLSEIPNVFTWAERKLKQAPTNETSIAFMPHCSALRMLTTALETGLRVQSVQWLDKTSWRRQQASTPADSYTFPLLVNTDKTKTNSWQTFVVYRVQHLLKRQEAFQEQFADADAYGPVDYEGLESSPFDPIRPLFRSTSSGYPLSDSLYDKYWRRIMIGFEAFYKEVTGESHVRMFRLQPRLSEDGTPVVTTSGGREERPYCPISFLAVHTPHSCRATFATNRKGVLELSDTAQLIGHANEVVTAHYDKPSEEDLQLRLQESDAAVVRDFKQFEEENGSYVRADKPNSALVKSFNRNRGATVKAFKFMPPIAIWSTEDSNEESRGLSLLRDGPMSKIRFRETHICPVGEECPSNILEQIGEPRRCGSCPLAMKCVDHLPAIAAKRNQLLERIKFQHNRRAQLEARGEPTAVLDEVWEAIELDVNELLGWQLSEEILESMRSEPPEERDFFLHVEQPEVVRRHLERVTRSSSAAEFMLQRIADSNAFPSMATPQVQLAASQVKRRLLAGRGLDVPTCEDIGLEDVRSVSEMLALMMKTEGVSMKQVAARLSEPSVPRPPTLTLGLNDGL